jgi:hypothetical protein
MEAQIQALATSWQVSRVAAARLPCATARQAFDQRRAACEAQLIRLADAIIRAGSR